MDSLEKRNEFLANPHRYFKCKQNWTRPLIMSHPERVSNKEVSHAGYDVVELKKGTLVEG